MNEAPSDKASRLRSEIEAAKTPEDRVEALNRLGEELIFADPDRAKTLAMEALEISRRSGFTERAGIATYVLAAVEYAGGRFVEAEKQAREAFLIGVRGQFLSLQFRAQTLIGGINGAIGNTDESMRAALEAFRLAEEMGDLTKQAVALQNLSLHYRESKDYEKALQYLNRSLELREQVGSSVSLGQTYRELGSVHVEMGDLTKSLEYLNKALEIERASGQWLLISDVLNNLGVVYSRSLQFEEAEKNYQEALEIRQRLGDPHSVSSTLLSIGVMRLRMNDFKGAIESCMKALEIAETVGSKKNQMRIHSILAEIYEGMSEFKRALDHFKIAHTISEELQQGTIEERERRIRAQGEAERARREAEIERLKTGELVKAQRLARVGSYIWDADRDQFTGSEEFYRLLGQSSQLVDCNLERFLQKIRSEDRGQVKKAFQSAAEWKTGIDVVARSEEPRGSEPVTFHIMGEWVKSEDRARGSLNGTLQDVSLQLEADEARREREKLQGMLEMAGAFSHEINQPMQVIVTSAELLQHKFPANSEVMLSVEKVLQAATRMSEITSRLAKATTYKTKKYLGDTRIVDVGEEEKEI